MVNDVSAAGNGDSVTEGTDTEGTDTDTATAFQRATASVHDLLLSDSPAMRGLGVRNVIIALREPTEVALCGYGPVDSEHYAFNMLSCKLNEPFYVTNHSYLLFNLIHTVLILIIY